MEVDEIVKFRSKNKFLGKLVEVILKNKGIYIPRTVIIGKNVKFPHNSVGTVIHSNTIIEDNVKIYQNVTIGRSDIYQTIEKSKMKSIHIKDGAILCAGAKILCKEGILTVGRNTVIGANAVLTQTTGDNEIWGRNTSKKNRRKERIIE